jgi:hypothetical protein
VNVFLKKIEATSPESSTISEEFNPIFSKRALMHWSKTPTYTLQELSYQFLITLGNFYSYAINFKLLFAQVFNLFRKTVGDGLYYMQGLFIMFFIDACLTDDEPL